MIATKDRSGWFGASDTAYITGNWSTRSFMSWWRTKLGTGNSSISTRAMMAGTAYEHKILDFIGCQQRDRQIKIRRYRLRVNLDGEDSIIREVKTHGKEKFVVSKQYWQQVQVEMFAANKGAEIVSYRLTEDDYDNYFNQIDATRIGFHAIERDDDWIQKEYLPKLKYCAWCLRRKRTPNAEEFIAWGKTNFALRFIGIVI